MATPDKTRLTYFHDRLRAVGMGILETAQQTFLVWIAIRVFEAGPTIKAVVASGPMLGLLCSLVLVSMLSLRGVRPSRAGGHILLVGALAFTVASLWPCLPVFVIASVCGMASLGMIVPLLTQIYQDNYPAKTRGNLFSRAVMIRVAVGALFSFYAGRWLAAEIGWYRVLLAMYAGASLLGAYSIFRCPSEPLRSDGGSHPLRALRFIRDDGLFRFLLIWWMVMGFANLMMLPLRVDYLANPVYGLELSATRVALLIGVIPNLTRLVMSPFWGWLFDRMNFFRLRGILNLTFVFAIVIFFYSRSTTGFAIAAVFFGIGRAGGEVAWSLWVTKVAPPHRVADYMSVHTFSTGVRGLVAPLVGFHLANLIGIIPVAMVSGSMILVASIILLREARSGQGRDPGTMLVERGTNP